MGLHAKVEHISYTTGTRALPNIYALALGPVALVLVCIYQEKHSCAWYNYYMHIYIFIILSMQPYYFYPHKNCQTVKNGVALKSLGEKK